MSSTKGLRAAGSGLTAVLADDEELARDELGFLLGQIGGVEIVGEAGNGVEAVATINGLKPDVVFLDIQMPGLVIRTGSRTSNGGGGTSCVSGGASTVSRFSTASGTPAAASCDCGSPEFPSLSRLSSSGCSSC